jgi:hypothetical protein
MVQASPQWEVGGTDWPSLWEQVSLLGNIWYVLVYYIPRCNVYSFMLFAPHITS